MKVKPGNVSLFYRKNICQQASPEDPANLQAIIDTKIWTICGYSQCYHGCKKTIAESDTPEIQKIKQLQYSENKAIALQGKLLNGNQRAYYVPYSLEDTISSKQPKWVRSNRSKMMLTTNPDGTASQTHYAPVRIINYIDEE